MGNYINPSFQARLVRLGQKTTTKNKRFKRWRRRKLLIFWRVLALLFAVFIGFKTTLILVEKTSILETRAQALENESSILRYAGKVFRRDPVSTWLADVIKSFG